MSRDKGGFTLIEVILVIILMGIITGAFAAGLVPTMQAYLIVDTRKEALQNARLAMDRMVNEIRLIRSATATDIQTFTANNLKFNDAFNNSIEFNLSGGGPPYNLLRNTDILSGNVQSLSFTYLDKNANPASVETDIWRIQIDLQVKVGDETVQLRSEVNPGNFQ
jgi:prepilin-type N-terminal cleavage/methylation domain-containing protein